MKRLILLIVFLLFIPCLGGGSTVRAKEDVKINAKIIENDDSYETVIVADAVVTEAPFNADATGIKDSTQAVKDAISYVSDLGGGTVYFPKGRYRITGSITVNNYVTLMGQYADPDLTTDYGTMIIADVNPSLEELPGLFRLRGSSGVVGFTIWYPQQTLEDVRPFPYTFEIMGGANTILEHMQFTIQNVTLLNSYKGVAASRTINPNVAIGVQDAHENLVIENLKGTPLKYGINSVNESDIGYFKNICFSPKYWAKATDLHAPSLEQIREYTYQDSCGLMLGDLEWSPYYNITVSGYKTGVHIIKGTRIQEENPIAFMGGFYNLMIDDCVNGLIVDSLYKGWGMLVTGSTISASKAAVVNNSSVGYVRLTDTLIKGAFYGERIYLNSAKVPVVETDTPQLFRPIKKLFNVLDYGAIPDGYTECGNAIQNALNDAKNASGGIVYLPAGYYKVSFKLKIPQGVQLRGAVPIANRDTLGKSEGTIVFCYYNQPENGDAFITLAENAGVYGLRICYPDNNLWLVTQSKYEIAASAFTICLEADGSYCQNVGLVNSYNGIKVLGNHTTIKNIPALFFNIGILVDQAYDVHVENVFSNATVATQSGYQQKFPELFKKGWLWTISNLWNYYTYTETHTKIFEIKDSKNVNIMSVFTFCSAQIVQATNSEVFMNGCGADRMWQEGIVVDLVNSKLTMINQLKYNCMMFNMDGSSDLSIYGRMNLILGNSPATKDVEHNMVHNKTVRDTYPTSILEPYIVKYQDDRFWSSKPMNKNPLSDILGNLK